jgi:hypothetical protein
LRQHADNPVHWQPWNNEALVLARNEDKPILLSVGYAACHWCHVMAHESFEDEETAALMNRYFINIKVDREERPDIDRIYQAAHYVFTRRAGGWPLTIFLAPTGEPFFGGTYFPKNSGRGLPSFTEVMQKVSVAWRDRRDDINKQNAQVLPLLRNIDSHPPVDGEMSARPLAAAAAAFSDMFDRDNGGFKGAPKFPHPVELTFCLEEGIRTGDEFVLSGVRLSLEKIAAGGMCDHLGGGFFRYSVDDCWAIPHFEKMLYDNGLLLALFADGARAFSLPALATAATGVAQWVLREMQHRGGGFYSSLDADSEGGEGTFYAWELTDIEKRLTAAEYAAFSSHFGLAAGANFEGLWHLARRQTVAQTAAALKIASIACDMQIESAMRKLFEARTLRVRPATDDKILAAWNGLLIRGLARAGRLMQRPDWILAASEALAFIHREMMVNGRLRAVWREGQCGDSVFLDDCVFLLDAALELLRAEFSPAVLTFACDMAAELQTHFEDVDVGGFFFTPVDGEILIRRLKPVDDNAIPCGNGVAVRALSILSWLTGEPQWATMGERALLAFYGAMERQPAGCASLLTALRMYLTPPTVVFLTGEAAVCARWRNELENEYNPDLIIFILPLSTDGLPKCLHKPVPEIGVRAYVCEQFACRLPVDDWDELKTLLNE